MNDGVMTMMFYIIRYLPIYVCDMEHVIILCMLVFPTPRSECVLKAVNDDGKERPMDDHRGRSCPSTITWFWSTTRADLGDWPGGLGEDVGYYC